MKFAEDIFPVGTFKKQRTDGAYINEVLAKNLDTLAKKINNDMHFMLLITGHDNVGNGKTTILTHIGSYLTWKINQFHKTNNTFEAKNIAFTSRDLIKKSLELPKLSVIGLDEGDELTTHGMKDLAVRLKIYFRKCRQLNQILILILPSFFELPKFYALARSVCLIDVKFMNEFERGYFSFYGGKSKKFLYLKGKKEWDYDVVHPDFDGRFFGSYCFFPELQKNTEEYLKIKFDDLRDAEEQLTPEQLERQTTIRIFNRVYTNMPIKITLKELAKAFGIGYRTAQDYISKPYKRFLEILPPRARDEKYSEITDEENNFDEEEQNPQENKEEIVEPSINSQD